MRPRDETKNKHAGRIDNEYSLERSEETRMKSSICRTHPPPPKPQPDSSSTASKNTAGEATPNELEQNGKGSGMVKGSAHQTNHELDGSGQIARISNTGRWVRKKSYGRYIGSTLQKGTSKGQPDPTHSALLKSPQRAQIQEPIGTMMQPIPPA